MVAICAAAVMEP